MPFSIIQQDLTRMHTDAIVNTTDRFYSGSGGVDRAIHQAAGPELFEACGYLGRLHLGEAKATKGYRLPVPYIIHTSGPRWRGGSAWELEQLANCYKNSIALARKNQCASIAFPLISSQTKHFPKEVALSIAIRSIRESLEGQDDIDVYLVVYGRQMQALSETLFPDVQQIIEADYQPNPEYVQNLITIASVSRTVSPQERGTTRHPDGNDTLAHAIQDGEATSGLREVLGATKSAFRLDTHEQAGSAATPARLAGHVILEGLVGSEKVAEVEGLADAELPEHELDELMEDLLNHPTQKNLDRLIVDESFAQMLARLLKERQLKHCDVYDALGMTNVGFWKLLKGRSNPSKMTVFGLAIAFKLSIADTKEMLMKAGYAINQSSLQDVVIAGLIKKGVYDRYAIDELLYALDLQVLPGAIIE